MLSTTFELLIFDCDGVLIDSEPAASRVLWQALSRSGVAISHEDVHSRFVGYSEEDARRICIEELGASEPDLIFAEARDNLYAEFRRSLEPMAGMSDLIRDLGCLKCVASNSGMERLERSLGLFDLWGAFAPNIFSAEMVARPKPAPDLFYLCAAKLGVDPARCVVIDDSVHGVAGAVAAGMTAIGFVDPADMRDGRADVLASAGASEVVTGAGQLGALLNRENPGATARPSSRGSPVPALT
ncbi:HAD family hydrolase [Mesorhizobium sp. CAU 1732]|uniref:HAD family hydrolase n=1 Tax=Mesorhizobium sp. CAU 1732 TaxID=3140358 RepID=UPI00326041D5